MTELEAMELVLGWARLFVAVGNQSQTNEVANEALIKVAALIEKVEKAEDDPLRRKHLARAAYLAVGEVVVDTIPLTWVRDELRERGREDLAKFDDQELAGFVDDALGESLENDVYVGVMIAVKERACDLAAEEI